MKATVCLLALVLAALCPSAARADVRIFVEDFSDASGHAAFDPLFNHSCVDLAPMWWDIMGTAPGLALYSYHVDTITFNLQPDWSVIGASVESYTGPSSARFIGTDDTTVFAEEMMPTDPPFLWHASADDIGRITAIELSALQGFFDNVTIEVFVVPEPSTVVLLATGLVVAIVGLARRRLT
jgi:hypothetical protein